MKRAAKKSLPNHPATNPTNLREQILAACGVLHLPLTPEALDAALSRVERERLSHLEFLNLLLSEPANQRRERAIARRIREAKFRDVRTLATFDWEFNAKTIDRLQLEELATAEFVRRRDNLIFVGQSGVGKSHLIQAIGHSACVRHRVRYVTSAELLQDLTASLADRTLPERVRYWARFELLIVDEFGYDKIERQASSQASNLLFKIMDARSQKLSTALVTNVDFDLWSEYLGDAPLAMGFLDRLVDGAIIVKMKGKSYRAYRAQQRQGKGTEETGKV